MIELKDTVYSDSNTEFDLLEDGEDDMSFQNISKPNKVAADVSVSVESHDFEAYESEVYKHYQLSR